MAHAKLTAFDVKVAGSLAPENATPAMDASTSGELPPTGYLTADWVKRHYSISNSTLYKWIAEGRFPAPVKIGPRAVRWTSASLRAFEAKLMENGQ